MNNFSQKYILKSIFNNTNLNEFLSENTFKRMRSQHSSMMDFLAAMGQQIHSEKTAQEQQRAQEVKTAEENRAKEAKERADTARQIATIKAIALRQNAAARARESISKSAYYDAKAAQASMQSSRIEQQLNRDEEIALRNAAKTNAGDTTTSTELTPKELSSISPPPTQGRGAEQIARLAQNINQSNTEQSPRAAVENLKNRLPSSKRAEVFPTSQTPSLFDTVTGPGIEQGVSVPEPTNAAQVVDVVLNKRRRTKGKETPPASAPALPKTNKSRRNTGKKTPLTSASSPAPAPAPETSSTPRAKKITDSNRQSQLALQLGTGNKKPVNKSKKGKPSNTGISSKEKKEVLKDKGGPKGLTKEQKKIAAKIKKENLKKKRETNESVDWLLYHILNVNK